MVNAQATASVCRGNVLRLWGRQLHLECGSCDANFYQDAESHRATSCTEQPKCIAGEKITPASLTQKRLCSACEQGTFQPSSEHQIETCNVQPSCEPGFFISKDSKIVRRVCNSCAAGSYQDVGNHQEEECKQQEVCNTGELITPDSTTERRTCKPCPENTFQTALKHQESSCILQPTCAPGQAISSPDSKVQSRECFDCTEGTYQDESAHRSESCKPQPKCSSGNQFVNPKGAEGLGECVECKPRTFQPLEMHRERECISWTVCNTVNNEQYIAENGTFTADTLCGSNVECSDGQWQAQAPSEIEPRICVGLTACVPGNYISKNHTGTADRVCTPCNGVSEWQDDTNQHQCNIMATCSKGEKVVAGAGAGSTRTDLSCEVCPPNAFQNVSMHRLQTCFQQEYCSIGEAMSLDSNALARTCTQCPNGTYQDAAVHRYDQCTPYSTTVCGVNERLTLVGANNTDQQCEPCESGEQVQTAENHTFQYCDNTTTTTSTTTLTTTSATYTIDGVSLGKLNMLANTTDSPLKSSTDDPNNPDAEMSAFSFSGWIMYVAIGVGLLLIIMIACCCIRKKRQAKQLAGTPSVSYENPMYNNPGKLKGEMMVMGEKSMEPALAVNDELYDDLPTGGIATDETYDNIPNDGANSDANNPGYLDVSVRGADKKQKQGSVHGSMSNNTYGVAKRQGSMSNDTYGSVNVGEALQRQGSTSMSNPTYGVIATDSNGEESNNIYDAGVPNAKNNSNNIYDAGVPSAKKSSNDDDEIDLDNYEAVNVMEPGENLYDTAAPSAPTGNLYDTATPSAPTGSSTNDEYSVLNLENFSDSDQDSIDI